MINQRRVSIDECAKLAGVTQQTVTQYINVGLLNKSEEDAKLDLGEVTDLFFLKEEDISRLEPLDTQEEIQEATPDYSEDDIPQEEEIDSSRKAGKRTEEDTYNFEFSTELMQINKILRVQLSELREERNWLRARVERLEGTVERSQIIALEASSLEEKKQLPAIPKWKALLPWYREGN